MLVKKLSPYNLIVVWGVFFYVLIYNFNTMAIISIETSCDETGVSIIDYKINKDFIEFNTLANELFSQIDIHKEFGGVFPTLAKRSHKEFLPKLIKSALKNANLLNEENKITDIDIKKIENFFDRDTEAGEIFLKELSRIKKPIKIEAIAVTNGPGLSPCLHVGVNFAKALSYLWDIPIYPINHMKGHLVASLAEGNKIIMPKFPLLSLLVSGGHTELIYSETMNEFIKLGSTKDDAVGEAFDKVARILDYPFPGGPSISKIAEKARESREDKYNFTRPIIHDKSFDFSYSGLKTAVLYAVNKIDNVTETDKEDIARSFEDAAVDVLIKKTEDAIKKYSPKSLSVGGGVSANKLLRTKIQELGDRHKIDVYIPEIHLTTDNALMISLASIYGKNEQTSPDSLNVDSNLSF